MSFQVTTKVSNLDVLQSLYYYRQNHRNCNLLECNTAIHCKYNSHRNNDMLVLTTYISANILYTFRMRKKKNAVQRRSKLYLFCLKKVHFMHVSAYTCFFSSAEVVKNALKHLRTPKDTCPAVKISGPDYHPCSKHCVFVCQRLIPLQPSHLHILPLHPQPIPRIQLHFVRSHCAAITKKGCKCSCGHSVCPSNCCHVAGTMRSPLF